MVLFHSIIATAEITVTRRVCEEGIKESHDKCVKSAIGVTDVSAPTIKLKVSSMATFAKSAVHK